MRKTVETVGGEEEKQEKRGEEERKEVLHRSN